MNKQNRVMVIIFGPTGVGKTDSALELANRLNGEIINMDMGALYTPLTIGTAKPDWRSFTIPHHVFDIIDSPRNLTVVEYRKLVTTTLEAIWQRGKLPILVGGSGFYLKSLFYPPAGAPIAASNAYVNIPEKNLWQHLFEIDPHRAQSIDSHDMYRIKRALDIWYSTGEKPSSFKPIFKPLAPFALFFLNRDRHELYARINERVVAMIDAGWIEEVKALGQDWKEFILNKKIIGYDDIINYLSGEGDKNELLRSIKKKTRNYAKRQITFWRSLQKDLQDALAEYTDSNLVARSSIREIDVAQENCMLPMEKAVEKLYGK